MVTSLRKGFYVLDLFILGLMEISLASKAEDAALMDLAEEVEAAFIAEPSCREKREAWEQMQDRLLQMWRPGVKEIADHIDHAVKWAGIDHVGIGSDFDGIAVPPKGLEDISRMALLWEEMSLRGYTQEQIKSISGGNLMAAFRRIVKYSE